MDDLLAKAVEGLLTSGPIAIVLGIAIKQLWVAYLKLQEDHRALQERLLKILENATHEDNHG